MPYFTFFGSHQLKSSLILWPVLNSNNYINTKNIPDNKTFWKFLGRSKNHHQNTKIEMIKNVFKKRYNCT